MNQIGTPVKSIFINNCHRTRKGDFLQIGTTTEAIDTYSLYRIGYCDSLQLAMEKCLWFDILHRTGYNYFLNIFNPSETVPSNCLDSRGDGVIFAFLYAKLYRVAITSSGETLYKIVMCLYDLI